MKIGPGLVVLALAAGCGPEGPGARGTITLGAGVATDGMTALEIRGLVAPPAGFTPTTLLPDDACYADQDGLIGFAASVPLVEVRFPYAYQAGCSAGTTAHVDWELVAWLAPAAGGGQIGDGNWFGARAFTIGPCGRVRFCGHSDGIDLVLDQQAP